MIEDYYICLDATALYFAHKYLADKACRVMRCYTGREVEIVVRTMEANKSKNFYTLRTMQNKMLKAKIKNLEVLGTVFERADKGKS